MKTKTHSGVAGLPVLVKDSNGLWAYGPQDHSRANHRGLHRAYKVQCGQSPGCTRYSIVEEGLTFTKGNLGLGRVARVDQQSIGIAKATHPGLDELSYHLGCFLGISQYDKVTASPDNVVFEEIEFSGEDIQRILRELNEMLASMRRVN